eukprot:127786_1
MKDGFKQYKFKCEKCGQEYQSSAWFVKHKCKPKSKKKNNKVSDQKKPNVHTQVTNNNSTQNIDTHFDNRRIIDAVELVEMKRACTEETMDSKYKLLARSQITLTQLLHRRELYRYSNAPYSILIKTYDDARNWNICPFNKYPKAIPRANDAEFHHFRWPGSNYLDLEVEEQIREDSQYNQYQWYYLHVRNVGLFNRKGWLQLCEISKTTQMISEMELFVQWYDNMVVQHAELSVPYSQHDVWGVTDAQHWNKIRTKIFSTVLTQKKKERNRKRL